MHPILKFSLLGSSVNNERKKSFITWLLCLFLNAMILQRKSELVALFLLSSCCRADVCVMCLFLAVPWFGLRSIIVVFSGHAHPFLNEKGTYEITFKITTKASNGLAPDQSGSLFCRDSVICVQTVFSMTYGQRYKKATTEDTTCIDVNEFDIKAVVPLKI